MATLSEALNILNQLNDIWQNSKIIKYGDLIIKKQMWEFYDFKTECIVIESNYRNLFKQEEKEKWFQYLKYILDACEIFLINNKTGEEKIFPEKKFESFDNEPYPDNVNNWYEYVYNEIQLKYLEFLNNDIILKIKYQVQVILMFKIKNGMIKKKRIQFYENESLPVFVNTRFKNEYMYKDLLEELASVKCNKIKKIEPCEIYRELINFMTYDISNIVMKYMYNRIIGTDREYLYNRLEDEIYQNKLNELIN